MPTNDTVEKKPSNVTVNSLCQALLCNGWAPTGNRSDIRKTFSTGEYKDLSDNLGGETIDFVKISLDVNEEGEYVKAFEDDELRRNKIISFIDSIQTDELTNLQYNKIKPILDDLDDTKQIYSFHTSLQNLEERGEVIIVSRNIFLPVYDGEIPVDPDYVNKSAEVYFLLKSGLTIYLISSLAGEFKLDGNNITNSVEWFIKYLRKLHDLYPEHVKCIDETKIAAVNRYVAYNDFCRELLGDGWVCNQNSTNLEHRYSFCDYENLRDNTEAERFGSVFVLLDIDDNGEYESAAYAENVITLRYKWKADVNVKEQYNLEFHQMPLLWNALNPKDQIYRLFASTDEDCIILDRVIALPVDIDYINKSAEIHFLLSAGFELYLNALTFGSTLREGGKDTDNVMGWMIEYLLRLHGLYPEYVYRRDDKKDESADNIDNLQATAEQGDVEAQFSLATLYRLGEDIPQSYEQAAYYYQKAAEQGHAEAQYILGALYKVGAGVQQSYEKSAYWLQKAAEQGIAQAQNSIGLMYDNGKGVPQDSEKAVYWYQKAAEQGIAQSAYNLAVSYRDGDGLPKNFEKAVEWYKKAADLGDVQAQFNMGVLYSNGEGVPHDTEKAMHWYQQAAEQGYADAQFQLGLLYICDKSEPEDVKKAIHWIRQAVEQGHIPAQEFMEEIRSQESI
jgi:TPR repeat protein